MWTADLAVGDAVRIPTLDPAAERVVTAEYHVTGTERITVPAGTFPTYRVEESKSDNSGVAAVLYLRADGMHVPIQIIAQGQGPSMKLQHIE